SIPEMLDSFITMANIENNKNSNEQHSNTIPEKIGEKVEQVKEVVTDVVQDPVGSAGAIVEQAAKDVTNVRWWVRLLLIIFWLSLSVIILALVAVNLPVTKRWAANQALEILNQDFKAEMTTRGVHVDYFGDVTIRGLTIKDNKGLEFIKVREFRANSNWIALASNAISGSSNSLSFDALTLTEADIKVITYKGDSISNFIRYIGNFDSGRKADPTKAPFQLNSRVELVNSKVSIINRNGEGDKGTWLMAQNLKLRAPSVRVNGGDVFAQVNNLNFATTRWGKKHTVDTFSADISLTNDFLSLRDLTLFTDRTLLQGDVKFNLN